MSTNPLTRLPRVPSTPIVRDACAKAEFFVSRVLETEFGVGPCVVRINDVPAIDDLREQAPKIVEMLEEVGNDPVVVNVKACTRGAPFVRSIVEQYKTEIDVICMRLIPAFRKAFVEEHDEAATTMVQRALLRVSPWMIDPRMNAYDLFKVLLPQCEHPGLLAGVFDHRVKPEYRAVRSA